MCRVEVFALEVEQERNSWPEKDERTRKWFAVADAAEAVEESELREAILKFETFAIAKRKNAKPRKLLPSYNRD